MCRRNVLISELLVVLLLGGAVAHAGSDIFSVNFYAYGRTNQGAGTEWNQEEWQKTITLEEGEAAGVDDWNTIGWENIVVPWDPSAPQDPVTITSNQGSTATFTLITVRNGNPRYRTSLRETLLGDGNADMMDGHANGTEDAGELFDMMVSDIPFALYDVIIYMGTQEAQFGDGTAKIVFNGGPEQDFTLKAGEFDVFTEMVDGVTPGNYILFEGVTGPSFTVQVWGNGFNHIGPTGFQFRQAAPEFAGDPDPAAEMTDVLRDVILSWTPGEFAATHDVYLGTIFGDVNDASRTNPRGVLASQDQPATTYDPPGRLDFGQTYYWRIDEVNAPPDSAIYKGAVWSFTTEPVAYPVAGPAITATASSSAAGQGPENTVNGSGLADDLHSDELTAMWTTAVGATGPAWIQYEFDSVLKLHQMWAWNHNGLLEPAIGFGCKDVSVEYSLDGTDYTALGTTHEFARAPGKAGYAHNTIVDFGGVTAKYVRLTVNSNWGGILAQYGLSEVRFFSIPVLAREPSPVSGATDVGVDAALNWRAGREAAKHNVYLSTDEQAVIDGTAPAGTVTSPSYTSSLDLAGTYYWRIDEVNDVETPPTWQGDLWNFSTQEYLVVDDFESYNDIEAGKEGSHLVYETWIDGFGTTTNGSTIGYTEAFQPSMESSTVYDGKQSVPLFYNNTTASLSEVTASAANLQAGLDWSKHSIKGLTLRFFGDPANALQQLYVKINGRKVTYDGSAENLRRAGWQMWYVDLASLGVNLSNVTTLAIGLERIGTLGGQGMILLDGIRLYAYDRQLITPVDPGTVNLQAQYLFEGNANDSSGKGRNGTIQGGPLFVPGKVGQAISLDGIDDYVTITGYKGILADASGVQQPFTIAAWVKTTESGDRTIASWGTNTSMLRVDFRLAASKLRVEHGAGNVVGRTALNDDNWHHVALTMTRGATVSYPEVQLWLDGKDDTSPSTTAAAFSITAGVDMAIGYRATAAARYFLGAIDDVRLYDRALSAEEMAWVAGQTLPVDKPF